MSRQEQEVDKFIDVLFVLKLITWDKHGDLQWWSTEMVINSHE